MDSRKKASHTGYHWRDELVENLLPFVKDGVDRKCLNNLVRGYVPVFFPTDLPELDGGKTTWLSVFSLGLSTWKQEIEDIGKELAEEPSDLNPNSVRRVFKKHNWKVEEPVKGISDLDKRGKWKYDAYKNKIAVEVELSSRSQIFKDAFKFLIGQAMSQIDVGVVMIRHDLEEQGKPYFGSVRRDWHAIYTSLPMLRISFHGFPNKI